MYVLVDGQGQVSLEDYHDFKRLTVVTKIDPCFPEGTHALAALGRMANGHIYLVRSRLRDMGPKEAGWRANFELMIEKAAQAGWVDNDGNVRAHIVFDA